MSNMQAQPQESEMVQGTVIGIIQKGADKWQVAVQPPNSQYTRNLWTKDQNLINQLSTMIGSQQAFMCGVSHWTNQQNQQVRSLWINGVGPNAAQQQPQQSTQQQWGQAQAQQADGMQTVGQVMQQPGVMPQQQAQTSSSQGFHDPKQPLIHRQTASKVAAHLMQVLPTDVPRDFNTFLVLCERLVAYYDHGVSTPSNDGWQHPDEDVPF